MFDPDLYKKANIFTPSIVKNVLDKYGHLFKWRSDNNDTILDIGCGPGDLTIKYLLPILPRKFVKLIGADISEVMIEHAKKKYTQDRISFCKIDMSDSNVEKYFPNGERFDHITSFICLQWISDQTMAMKNVYSLLKPGGDCLLAILADNDVYEAYSNLYKSGKWSKYMKDYKTAMSPYHNNNNKKEDICKYLTEAGFSDFKVELIENESYTLNGFEVCRNMIKSVNAFINRIPVDKQDEFMNDHMRIQFPYVSDSEADNFLYQISYTVIVVYARK